ncbi:unnamed protein product [Ascophyllum nodosum]
MSPLRAKNRENLELATCLDLTDKEERKRVRRLRVEQAIATRVNGGLDTSKNGKEASACSLSQQQVADLLAHLDTKKARGIDAVTAVRVAADDRETQRRMAEEQARQERLQCLQEEAVRSGKQNAAVEMRWAELLDENMPQELHRSIEEQKAACAEIVGSKDSLVNDFQTQLKTKDEEYVKALKQQTEDTEELIERMRIEFQELQVNDCGHALYAYDVPWGIQVVCQGGLAHTSYYDIPPIEQEEYEAELEAAEEVFLQERETILAANKADVNALFEKRREMELAYMENKQKRRAYYRQEIENLLTKDSEKHSTLKIKLETDVQTLEQQLEEMRATYLLNTEKLEYNYRVLTERDMENNATLSHQKRKLTKLKDALSGVVQRYQETDARDRRRNGELTDDYRRITKQYKDMQAKFRHFEIADSKRYEQVWAMHREEVFEAIAKVLQADEIISRQQLGWSWAGPNMQQLAELDINSMALAKTYGGQGTSSGAGESSPLNALLTSAVSSEGRREGEHEIDPHQPPEASKVSGTRVKAVLKLLSQEAGFLVDPEVKEALDTMTTDEAQLVSAVSMLNALGVEKQPDIEELMRYFFSSDDIEADTEDVPAMGAFRALGLDPDREPEALKVLLTIIQPDNVVSAIHSFVVDRKEARLLNQTRSKSTSLDDGGAGEGVGDAAGKARKQTEKVLRQRENDYWDILGGVIPNDAWQVWQQLVQSLEKYNAILAERGRRIASVRSLQEQNSKLKGMLRTYLGSAVNDDLIIPPTRTILIGAPSNGE